MTAEGGLLAAHIGAGVAALLIGPVAMAARKSPGLHTRAGVAYHWTVFAVCLTAVPLALLHWDRSAYLLPVSALSYGFAFRGYRAALLRPEGWLKTHIGGMLGSYIAMVTALLVVTAPRLPLRASLPWFLPWLLPTLVGVPLIFRVRGRFRPAARLSS